MKDYTEYFGYIASALVLVSFLMKNMTYLRIINSVGCAFFIIYGTLLGSVPIVLTNTAIVMVNFYYVLQKNKDF